MNKIYSTFMFLSMLTITCLLTSCGSDNTEIDPGSLAEGEIVMTFNGTITKLPNYAEALSPTYLPKTDTGAEFVMMCPQEIGTLNITYFKISYPNNIEASSFKVGESLVRDGVELLFTDGTSGTQVAQYLIGSSKVLANDGTTISVAFENLKATTTMPLRSLLISKGTIKFKVKDKFDPRE